MSKKKNEAIAPDEALSKAEAYVIKHKTAFIAVIVAIIAFAAFQAFTPESSESKGNNEADAAVAKVEHLVLAGNYDIALEGNDEIEGLLEIIEKYSGTSAANKANLFAGIAYAQKKQYNDAITYLSQYNGGDNIAAANAKHLLGTCYSQIEEYEKAISTVLEAAALADNAGITPLCWRDAAAMYEVLDNDKEAMNLYNRIKNEYPYSPVAEEAEFKINAVAK